MIVDVVGGRRTGRIVLGGIAALGVGAMLASAAADAASRPRLSYGAYMYSVAFSEHGDWAKDEDSNDGTTDMQRHQRASFDVKIKASEPVAVASTRIDTRLIDATGPLEFSVPFRDVHVNGRLSDNGFDASPDSRTDGSCSLPIVDDEKQSGAVFPFAFVSPHGAHAYQLDFQPGGEEAPKVGTEPAGAQFTCQTLQDQFSLLASSPRDLLERVVNVSQATLARRHFILRFDQTGPVPDNCEFDGSACTTSLHVFGTIELTRTCRASLRFVYNRRRSSYGYECD